MKTLLLATAFAAAFFAAAAQADDGETLAMAIVKFDMYGEKCAPLSASVAKHINNARPAVNSAKYLAALSQMTILLKEPANVQLLCLAMKSTMWMVEKDADGATP